ncbi:MAG: hypothetical protein ACUVX8_03950 [Candidatus Zipacnadales bacterium]
MIEQPHIHLRRIVFVAVMGGVALLIGIMSLLSRTFPSLCGFLGFTFASGLLGTRTIRLSRSLGTISVGFLLVFATAIELGPLAGMVSGLAAALGGTVLCTFLCGKGRRPRALIVFGAMANIALAAGAAGWVFIGLERICADVGLPYDVLPAFTSMGIYYLVNSLGVAGLASLDGRRSVLAIWSDNLSWTVLPFYLGGAVVLLIHVLSVVAGPFVYVILIPTVSVIHLSLEYRAKARFRHSALCRAKERTSRQ